MRQTNRPISARQKIRHALEEMEGVIQEKFFSCEGNCAVVRQQLKDEYHIDIHERRLRRFCAPWREQLKGKGKSYERYETEPGQH